MDNHFGTISGTPIINGLIQTNEVKVTIESNYTNVTLVK